jgi:hypothetical protein
MYSSEPTAFRITLFFLLIFILLFAFVVNFALMERLSRPTRYHRQQAKHLTTRPKPQAPQVQPTDSVKENPQVQLLPQRSI